MKELPDDFFMSASAVSVTCTLMPDLLYLSLFLQYVIVVFPAHTHLLFFLSSMLVF